MRICSMLQQLLECMDLRVRIPAIAMAAAEAVWHIRMHHCPRVGSSGTV